MMGGIHMFNDLPPIHLESEQVSGLTTMANHGPSGWRPTVTSYNLEGPNTLSFKAQQTPWNPYKSWDESRVHWAEQDRSLGNLLPSWRSKHIASETNGYFTNHVKVDPLTSLNPSFASSGYGLPHVDDRIMSEQSSSPGGSSWSPEPSEDHTGFESGEANSHSKYTTIFKSTCTTLDRDPSQSYSCRSPSFSDVSSYTDSRSISGIALQDVQQYPDTLAEEYENKVSGVGISHPGQFSSDHPASWRVLGDVGIVHYNHYADTTPGPGEDSTLPTLEGEETAMKSDSPSEGENDSGSDYTPASRKTAVSNTRNSRGTRALKQSKTSKRHSGKSKPKSSSVIKRTTKSSVTVPVLTNLTGYNDLETSCSQCSLALPTKSALKKHISSTHTRPFTCTFRLYGCSANFGSKNEWKRHVSSQHLRLGIWRCDLGACLPQHTLPSPTLQRPWRKGREITEETDVEELVYNDFNRKDLFTQHLRRMHAPPGSSPRAEHEKFNASLDLASKRCLQSTREPPSYSVCGYCPPESTGNAVVFRGPGSWENRMEHVGRHLESGHGENRTWREDLVLRNWMVQERLIEEVHSGVWRLPGLSMEEEKGRGTRGRGSTLL